MRTTSLALVLVGALFGCSSSPSTRAVSGQLRVDTSAMSHPVVLAQSSDHRVFVADVTAAGRFTLQLPPNVSYRMTLASSTRTPGIYSAVARINWPLASGPARWAALGDGAAIDLGAVYHRGSKPSGGVGISCDGCGGGGKDGGASGGGDDHGDCHEDDHAGCQSHGSDGDADCDHKLGGGDKCDKDDDGDKHDHECDDDDHQKCSCDGGDHEDDHGGGGNGGGGEGDHGGGGGHACDGGTGGAGGGGGGGAGGGGGGAGGGDLGGIR